MSKIPTWSDMWSSFVSSVKDQSWEAAEEVIRNFVEELRRVRHNTLCASKKNVLNRNDRQVWPAETIAKLFLEGRIDEFKAITEEYAGDDPADEKWHKRWTEFVESLSDSKTRVAKITRFMTSQRTKKHRRKINSDIQEA